MFFLLCLVRLRRRATFAGSCLFLAQAIGGATADTRYGYVPPPTGDVSGPWRCAVTVKLLEVQLLEIRGVCAIPLAAVEIPSNLAIPGGITKERNTDLSWPLE